MDTTLLVLLICQGSAVVLNAVCTQKKNYLEVNDKYLSPKDKTRYSNKIRIFVFFEKLLKTGSILYFLLSLILNFGRLILT